MLWAHKDRFGTVFQFFSVRTLENAEIGDLPVIDLCLSAVAYPPGRPSQSNVKYKDIASRIGLELAKRSTDIMAVT